jgi:hypothetical protein
VRRQSSNGLAFKNFNARRSKVARALNWLKQNNRYYTNIVIDDEVLRSLPENGPIDNQLPHIEDVEHLDLSDVDSEEDLDDAIGSNFVPAPLPSPNEDRAIADTFERLKFTFL